MLSVVLVLGLAGLASASVGKSAQVSVDVSSARPTSGGWARCVGSGHAALALRSDWRAQLARASSDLGFEYVRFHGVLDDDMSTCLEGLLGCKLSFYNADSIWDYLLSINMRPIVELSFMPAAIASGTQTCFHYKGIVEPPRNASDWSALIGAFAEHVVERYGIDEVSQWYFEVWNEVRFEQHGLPGGF
jgi:xylan 1,4-beta-xylosidase